MFELELVVKWKGLGLAWLGLAWVSLAWACDKSKIMFELELELVVKPKGLGLGLGLAWLD